MLRFLPAPIHGLLLGLGLVLNTVFWAVPLYAVALVKLLLPLPAARRRLSDVLTGIANGWIAFNSGLLRLIERRPWQISGVEGLRPDGWYLVCVNHLSAVDIPVLQRVFYRRIPFLRFFLKQELIWVPVLGLAWWALDFPFMRRYSAEYLRRHPEKRGVDVAATRRACAKFRGQPTSILNFLEGTRFTPAKRARQDSPYTHLLRPKAGGIASAVGAMGELFDAVLDVTIVYPDGPVGLWEMLCGRLGRVIVHVQPRPIPPAWLSGDYSGDPAFRAEFQAWVQQIWSEKDLLIGRLLTEG